MSDQQATLDANRLPLLRAAAHKQFDIKVFDIENNRELPFDLKKNQPGCYLNIRWKPLSLEDQTQSHSSKPPFPELAKESAGVRQFSKVKYLDPASIAYELHAYVISNVYGNDPKEVEFQKTKMLRGLWLYFAYVEHPDDQPLPEFGVLNMFWSMIIHYHRSGECLPRCEASWDEKAYAFNQLLSNFSKGGLSEAVANSPDRNKSITVPSTVMSFVLLMNGMMSAQGAKSGTPAFERNRCHVDFVTPTLEPMIPEWYRSHNELWTKTLDRFIKTGTPPCQWFLKEAGCKNRHVNGPTRCLSDHELFVPLVNTVMSVVQRPFAEQMKTSMSIEATGQGLSISPELLNENGALTKEERLNQLKEKGNALVQKQDYTSAIMFYTEAIKVDPKADATAAIYSNRSLCFIHKSEFKKALADADQCVSIRPAWFRGHFRRGFALERLSKFEDAIAAFEKGASLDEAQKKDAAEAIERCGSKLILTSADNLSKSAKKEALAKAALHSSKKDGTVTAVFFPCDPNRRPYEVSIPSDVVQNAHVVHSILGITEEQVTNIDRYWASVKTQVPEGTLPPNSIHVPYGMREWAQDYKLKNAGRSLPFAFLPKELCRGENDKSNLVALVNPQSKEIPNLRMCAMLTRIDGGANITDGNPNTCKCRGDALVIRINRSEKDSSPYNKDRRVLSWPVAHSTLQNMGKIASDRYDSSSSSASDPTRGIGIYVEISAVLSELLLNTKDHFAVNFEYDEYDKVWGFFASVQIPVEAVLARRGGGGGDGGGRGSRGGSRGRGGRGSQSNESLGPFYSSTLLPNTKASEKMYADIVRQAMNSKR